MSSYKINAVLRELCRNKSKVVDSYPERTGDIRGRIGPTIISTPHRRAHLIGGSEEDWNRAITNAPFSQTQMEVEFRAPPTRTVSTEQSVSLQDLSTIEERIFQSLRRDAYRIDSNEQNREVIRQSIQAEMQNAISRGMLPPSISHSLGEVSVTGAGNSINVNIPVDVRYPSTEVRWEGRIVANPRDIEDSPPSPRTQITDEW